MAPDWYVSGRIATAHKIGRSSDFPFVPVMINRQEGQRDITTQIRGYAFKTRHEAVEFAAAARLTDPGERACAHGAARRAIGPGDDPLTGGIRAAT